MGRIAARERLVDHAVKASGYRSQKQALLLERLLKLPMWGSFYHERILTEFRRLAVGRDE